MNNSHRHNIWNYKNFNIGTELEISGEFIYDGMQALNQMESMDQEATLFSFLYHISVGVERLQKIILVLLENITFENHKKFEKSLKTHNHSGLNQRISKNIKLQLNSTEKNFLELLTKFYKTARYGRFNIKLQDSKEQNEEQNNEQNMIATFIGDNLSPDKMKNASIHDEILINDDVKELFGCVVGKITKEYYRLICEECTKNNTYTNELRVDSKAAKIFLPQHKNDSLQEQKNTEMIVLKELLVYLRNTKESNSFIRFLDNIPPLKLDIALLNEHISELTKGIISQSLIDEVEELYMENSYSIERINLLDGVGKFDYEEIDDYEELN